MDGVSGPGVGSVSRVIHAGWVGMMIFVGSTKLGLGVGVVVADEQAEIREKRKMKDRIVDDLINFMCLVENVPKVSVKAMFLKPSGR